tara:strand:- start:374 stop:658 length:285 start_codon:yes stop_codon:yes gene_type:complete
MSKMETLAINKKFKKNTIKNPLAAEPIPHLVAHLEMEINWPWTQSTKTVYKQLIAPTQDHMECAIRNYASACGAIQVTTITPEAYQEATNESKT